MTFESLHILIIDDSPMIRSLVKQMLINFGVDHIYEAADGMTGLQVSETHYLDIILCDLSMEPVDGFEFVEFLRKHKNPAVRKLPVIILTMHGEEDFVKKASDLNIDGYLLKPISPKLLRSRIQQVMSRPKAVA